MSPETFRRIGLRHLVWLLLPAYLFGIGAMIWVEETVGAQHDGGWVETIGLGTGFGWFVLLGALIVSRQPRNPMGWILASIGTMISLFPTGHAWATYVVSRGETPSLLVRIAAWPNNWYWYILLLFLTILTPLLFPNGRLLSRRWRWVAWLAVSTASAISITGALSEDITLQTDQKIDNPFGIEGLPYVESLPVSGPLFMILAFCILASVLSVILRFRRSRGDEREQLKWFVFAILFLPLPIFLDPLLASLEFGELIGNLGFGFTINAIPIAIGIAILKYRLYDIDVVINKTFVYFGLAAFITLVYVGVVVGIGSLVGAGDEPNLGLSLVATGFVAVAFQPVRERVQRVANRVVYGQRLSPYEAVTSFSHRMAESLSFEEILPSIGEAAASAVGGERAKVKLIFPGGGFEEIFWPSDESPNDAFDANVGVLHQGEQVGEISVAKKRGEALTPREHKLLSDLASQAGLAFSNLRLTEALKAKLIEIRESRRRIVSAQDEERRRMERDIHDGAQQQLVSMSVKLGLARSLGVKDPERASALLEELRSESSEAVETLRDLARGLFPQILSEQGLIAALRAHIDKMQVPATVSTDSLPRLDPDVEAALYFVVREALQNATKHAKGAAIAVSFSHDDGRVSFSISDRGPGFDVIKVELGSGLQNMRDRIEAVGGTFEILSDAGTQVRGSVPATSLERVPA